MKIRNHIELITKSIEYVRKSQHNGDLTFNGPEHNFVLSSLESLVTIDGKRPVDRVNRGKTVSSCWAFYPFHQRGIVTYHTVGLQLKKSVRRGIRGSQIPIMLDMLNTIEHEIDLDATIRQLAHKEMGAYSPSVLHEKSCAINALKACITSQMEDIQDD